MVDNNTQCMRTMKKQTCLFLSKKELWVQPLSSEKQPKNRCHKYKYNQLDTHLS